MSAHEIKRRRGPMGYLELRRELQALKRHVTALETKLETMNESKVAPVAPLEFAEPQPNRWAGIDEVFLKCDLRDEIERQLQNKT